jgi:asparagine synthase (glutamine-hydrolysing)
MCGICGIVGKDAQLPLARDMLRKMVDVMKHRGPDGEGFHFDESVALGHTRLSIIDVECGAQPMSNEEGSLTIVCNGEVYNYVELRKALEEKGHKFRTKSDTEVVLHSYQEYGEECLNSFNGMFAFAIWDRTRKKLFLARDRLGVKPLYYFEKDGGLVFASETKALLKTSLFSPRPEAASVAEYMVRSYVTGEGTFLSGVKKLMPGHFLTLSDGRITKRKWWDVVPGQDSDLGEKHYVEELASLISDSVRLRLRSDVPVGAYLSGGIDSSTIVSTACGAPGRALKTFSGAFGEGPQYDERRYIRLVTEACGTEHHEVVPTMEEFFEKLPLLIWYLDEPVVGAGVFPQYAVSLLASRHVKVVLGGQGGDELFAGYPRYYRPYFLARLKDCARFRFGRGAPGTLPADFFRFVVNRGRTDVPLFLRRLSAPAPAGVLSPALGRLAQELPRPAVPAGLNGFERLLYMDLKEYLQGLLHVEDRASMAASIESRVPILDYRIVELAASIPYKYKMRKGLTKYVFRQAAKDRIPAQILGRRDKMGFPTPVDVWFARRAPAIVKFFESGEVKQRGVINSEGAARIVSEHAAGRRDNSALIWRMLNIELWFSIFIEGKQPGDIPRLRD